MAAKGFRVTQNFLTLQLDTLRDGATVLAMIDVAIHGITSIQIDRIQYLDRTKTYARTLRIEGLDSYGNRVTAHIPLFSKTEESLTLNQERALLSQRLDEIITCVKEID